MAILDPIRKNKKKSPKERLTIMVGEVVKGYIYKFSEQRPEKSATEIVNDAISFAYRNDMYLESREAINDLREARGLPLVAKPEGSNRPIAMDKKSWCTRYGGVCDGVNCVYTKYEVTPLGRVVKNHRSEPLRSMPENEVDFCKSVLGGFSTVTEAEVAFEKQDDSEPL